MAAENLVIVLIGGPSGTTHKQSKDLEMQLKSLGIGTSNIQITDLAGVLQIAARLKVLDATEADDVATKGQLDTAIATVSGNVGSAQGDITALTTSINSEIVDRTNADLNLQSQITSNDTDIANLQTETGTLQSQITANDADIAQLQTDVSDEATARIAADTSLSTGVTTLDGRVDGHDTSISSLQSSLTSIQNNKPKEETQTAGAGGQSVFTLASLSVDPDNTIYDIEAYIDGRRMLLDPAGGLTKGFRKNTATEIEFSETVPEGAEVTFWKQGTSSGGGGGSTDLESIAVNPKPTVNGGNSLGDGVHAWSGVFLKDKNTADVWQLEVIDGVFQATLVE